VTRKIDRRDALRGLGIATVAGLAGCMGGGDSGSGDDSGSGGDSGSGDDSESGDDDATDTETDSGSGDDSDTETDSGSSSTDSFEYTFGSNDDVSGSSLTGIQANYPDGSGAVSDAEVASVTLAGSDVSDDLDSTSTSNNGTSLTADFGGAYDVSAEDTLAMELSGVSAPDGSYTVEVVVNPQSGGTTFATSF
jgi:hypothetical protein